MTGARFTERVAELEHPGRLAGADDAERPRGLLRDGPLERREVVQVASLDDESVTLRELLQGDENVSVNAAVEIDEAVTRA